MVWYFAHPYSASTNAKEVQNYVFSLERTNNLLDWGYWIYSPISYTHNLHRESYRKYEFWIEFDCVFRDPQLTPHLSFRTLSYLHLGKCDLAQIEVRGERVDEVARRFVPYSEAARDRFGAARIIEKDTCTGCMGEVVSTFVYLREAGYGDRLADLTLIMGTPVGVASLGRTPVIVGRCARAYRNLGVFVPGCPPHGMAITDGACEALDIDVDVVHRVRLVAANLDHPIQVRRHDFAGGEVFVLRPVCRIRHCDSHRHCRQRVCPWRSDEIGKERYPDPAEQLWLPSAAPAYRNHVSVP